MSLSTELTLQTFNHIYHISDDLKSKSPLEAYVFHCLLHENHILTFQ